MKPVDNNLNASASATQTIPLLGTAQLLPVANAVSQKVAYDSTNNVIALDISEPTGTTTTSVAVASGPSHGTATASGTSISYTADRAVNRDR